MLCSNDTGRANSNWHDRLLSIKGFTTDDDIDLETFLSRQKAKLCNSSDVKLDESAVDKVVPSSNEDYSQARDTVDQKPPEEIPSENEEKDWKGVLSNVLAELFYMGDPSSKVIRKKAPRKQENPKIFLISNPPKVSNVALSVPVSDDSSRIEAKGKGVQGSITEQEDAGDVAPEDCDEEEKFPPDLAGFSRTEVTVIDTSCPKWKFNKMLYRKKNVWKARDKRGKAMNIGRKKRKLIPLERNGGTENKLKVSAGQCSSSKEANAENINMPLHQENDLGNNMEESCKQYPPKKRFPRKSKTGGSSGILIKNIPTGKKSNNAGPKNQTK